MSPLERPQTIEGYQRQLREAERWLALIVEAAGGEVIVEKSAINEGAPMLHREDLPASAAVAWRTTRPEREPVLCYVEGAFAYFTTQRLEAARARCSGRR